MSPISSPAKPNPIPAIGRYAPSPTGDLHLGNVRTALLAWLAARDAEGRFHLRIENIDLDRVVPGSAERIVDDLRWLGLDWDGPIVRQSERFDLYADRLRVLAAKGLLYACHCSRKDLREASAPHGPEGPIYPGTCRERLLDPDDLPACREPGEKPRALPFAVRLRLPNETIAFDDRVAGPQLFDLEREVGDIVVLRRDGLWSYQFACALDDALSGVTEVVRGVDLLPSTPRQIAIARALGLAPPASWLHVPLMEGMDGQRLAKRDGAGTLRTRRQAGTTRGAILAELAGSCGLIESTARAATLDELLHAFPGWLAERLWRGADQTT